MTTLIQFNPPPNQVFTFQPELDRQTYQASVMWSFFGNRWYLNLYALDGTLVFSKALIGSISAIPIQSLTWTNGYAVATTEEPHGFNVLDTLALTVRGCAPVGYNGLVRALITKANEFVYPIQVDLGEASTLGLVSYNINLAEGYFASSTLVFREASQQFEVNP